MKLSAFQDTEFGEAQDLADFVIAARMCGASCAVAAKAAIAAFFKDGRWIHRSAFGKRLPSREWQALRLRILERDGYVCAYCGDKADCVDHIDPIANGGGNSETNLAACCRLCNSSKGAKTLSEWRAMP